MTATHGVAFLRPLNGRGLDEQVGTLDSYLRRRRTGWEFDDREGWAYSAKFDCTPVRLQDHPYYYLAPDPPKVCFDGTAELSPPTDAADLLRVRTVGNVDHECSRHWVNERTLDLDDLTEPMLDAALTEIEVRLDVDELLAFIRCRLVGPCPGDVGDIRGPKRHARRGARGRRTRSTVLDSLPGRRVATVSNKYSSTVPDMTSSGYGPTSQPSGDDASRSRGRRSAGARVDP